MLLVSWNVAGLKPVLQRIHMDYGTAANHSTATTSSTRRPNRSASDSTPLESNSSLRRTINNKSNSGNNTSATPVDPFAKYLALHGDITILCLQEHKIPHGQLSSRSEPHRCSSVPGYESFWSCNNSTVPGKSGSTKSRGFNGVVTYAKVGTVQRSSCTPFNDSSLDNQGRCIVTDHGKWVLFNVYVPCGFSREKMRFLRALRKAMQRERDGKKEKGEKKSVVLVGDLNLKHCVEDVYWKNLLVDVDRILAEVASAKAKDTGYEEHNNFCDGVGSGIPYWKVELEKNWNRISTALQTIEAVPRKTTNPSTGESFDKFRARVNVIADNGKNDAASSRYVYLGSYEDSEEEALGCYNFDERTYFEDTGEKKTASTVFNPAENRACTTEYDNFNNEQQNHAILYRKKNLISIESLTELMSKIVNVFWDETTQREIAKSEGQLNTDAPDYLWMKKVLEEDGMVDVFRHFYPRADSRFTCWHQLRNKRYTNEGSRIDYTLVDQSLLEFVEKGEGTLRCGPTPHDNPLGEVAALMAATANGMFESGTFAGGGIASAPKSVLDTQFGPTHTGMIYTPPSYSDHIAVSLVFNDRLVSLMGNLILDEKDAATRRSQPHKKQRSIASFLAPKESLGRQSSLSSLASSQAVGDKRRTHQNGNAPKKISTGSHFFEANKLMNKFSSSSVKGKSSSTRKDSVNYPKNSILNHFKKA